MNGILWALLTVFGWGIGYFLAAIPVGVAMHLPPAAAAVAAWAGYFFIAAAMLPLGAPARAWLIRKFRIPIQPNPEKLFWRAWTRWGMPGLGLLAPVTCGPYFAAIIALALGESPRRLLFWIGLGAVPWCIVFAIMAALGKQILAK